MPAVTKFSVRRTVAATCPTLQMSLQSTLEVAGKLDATANSTAVATTFSYSLVIFLLAFLTTLGQLYVFIGPNDN